MTGLCVSIGMAGCSGGGSSQPAQNLGLQSITVTPAAGLVPVGTTQAFKAMGKFGDGSSQDLTASATWSSSATNIATISSSGVVTGKAQGNTTITATSASVSGSTTLTVTAPRLTSISVTPATPSVAAGLTQQFTATGTFTDGSTQNMTNSVTWSSNATGTATISSTGLAKGLQTGTATITATSGSVSGSATLTVSAPLLASIAVTPPNSSVAAGLPQQFTATGTFTDGTMQNLTGSVTWSSSTSGVATISSTGFATTKVPGSTTIMATSGSISGSTLLTVTAPVVTSIAVTPNSPSVAAGTTQQFAATGTFTDGSTQDLSASVTWSSSATGVATIGSAGLATSVMPGTTTITATSGSVSGSALLKVTNAAVASLLLTPATPSIPKGTTLQFAALASFSDGTTQDITAVATWTSSATTVATISGSGLATGLKTGTTTITANFQSVSNSTTMTVTKVSPVAINILPGDSSIPVAVSRQFKAVEVFNDGSMRVLPSVAWSSTASSVATITSAGGLATAVGVGTTTISATNGFLTGSTNLTVDDATLTTLSIAPAIPTIQIGKVVLFSATGFFSDGSTIDLSTQVNWSLSTPAVATITNFGFATAASGGTTTITAGFASQTASTTLTVPGATLLSITINPANPTIATQTTEQFTATGSFSDGSAVGVSDVATWSTSDLTVATIVHGGLATGVGVGTTTVSATLGSVTGSTSITTTPATLVSLAITPVTPTVPANIDQQFAAIGTFSDGSTQNLTGLVNWSSGNTAIAAVSDSPATIGLATGIAPGTTAILASLDSVVGSTNLTVTNARLVSLAVTPTNSTLTLGGAEALTATGTFSDGSVINLSQQVTWTSSDITVAVINSSGLLTSAGTGTTAIQAVFGSVSGATSLTVR